MVKARTSPIVALLVFFVAASTTAAQNELVVVEEESIFAVVTHKAGFASGMAHNHLVAAGSPTLRVSGREEALEAVSFEIELAAQMLVVDAMDLQQEWYPRLAALGILDEPFAEVSEKQRDKIRGAMLGKKQLDAASHPTIRARLVALVAEASTLGELATTHRATVAFEVHGETVSRAIPASVVWDDGQVRVEAAGVFQFSDFGIEPYSAFLGAVKNLDEFHVFVSFLAKKPAPPDGD